MLKKIASMLLVILILFSLSACETADITIDMNYTSDDSATESFDSQNPNYSAQSSEGSNSYLPDSNKPQNNQTDSSVTLSAPTDQQPSHIHTYSDATCTTPRSCSCGVSVGVALGHTFTPADCDSPKTCSRCGTTSGNALGHTFTPADCNSPKTCSRCGTTSGNALGHTFTPADCNSPKTCSRCGTTSGNALGHSYSNNKCSRCGKIDPDSLPTKLEDIPVINSDPSFWYSYNDEIIKDSYGNTYSGYHKLGANGLHTLVVDYNIGSKYKTFSCDLVAGHDMLSDGKLDIQFFVDDDLVYYKTDYTKTTGPIHIEFSIKNGQRLTIKVTKTDGGLPGHGADLLLVNAELLK